MTTARLSVRSLAVAAALVTASADCFAQAPALAQLRFDIVGVRLVVDPPALTVPKNIATQINTSLVLPPGSGAETKAAIDTLTEGALVEAELRGPSLTPTRIVARPGQPIPLPPFALPGDYFLDGIRLTKDGQPLLDATATDGHAVSTIPIKVISEVFVTSVTSRPLSLDEIRGKGIVIDEANFKAVSFQVAFNIDGTPFTISVPAALPTPEFLRQRPTQASIVQQLTALNQSLRATETSLPPQFDRPGLNFSIAALPFFPVVPDDGGVPPLDIPPLTGLVVIPGNVAFLNQFFSVLLVVTNVAPDGTPLELRDATAQIVLPTGLDHVAGSYDQPGDDPLRLARVNGIGVQPTVAIVQPGPDGKTGTADDIAAITPQRSGEGEFLVEGLQEGSHVFDLSIHATLFGLPSGPIDVVGAAAGAVFVRNPTFSVTLAHPRTIRAGERYDLFATVTNTSQSAANLVRLNLEPNGISGAQLVSDATVAFDTIAPGEARTATFTLIAQKTGDVTFTSFTGNASAGGAIELTTGVDERGAPLAPNAIVLPRSADALPASLVAAAQRVLGQAFSIATAPAAALPPDVLFVKRQTVVDRAVALAEAGERIGFGEPLSTVVRDLLLDWLGNAGADDGFDQLLRTTEAGAGFVDEIASAVASDASRPGALDYQRAFAIATAGRAPHLSAIAAAAASQPAPLLTVSRSDGTAAGQGPGGMVRTLASAAALALPTSAPDTRFVVDGIPAADRYTVEMTARSAGNFDLGVVVPGPAAGQLTQWRFAAVPLAVGGVARVDVDLSSTAVPVLSIDTNGDGIADAQRGAEQSSIVEEPPKLLAAEQLLSAARESGGDLSDPATYGLLVAVLFDKPVSADAAELKTNYAIASNSVIGARLQSSQRVVYLYLQRPIGSLVARDLTVTGVTDLRGHPLGAASHAILMRLTDGAHVFGQVRNADGSGVPASTLKLTVSVSPSAFDVSTIQTDQNGGFDFDFVPRLGNLVLQAQQPVTLDVTTLTARIRAPGEQLLLNPTFTGRGSVRGRVLAGDGATPIANAPVALLPGSVLGLGGFQSQTNALGEFVFTGVPVGVFTLTASDQAGRLGETTGVLPTAGALAVKDVVLSAPSDTLGHLVGRVFLGDGATPGAGFAVYVGRYDRDSGLVQAFDQTTADAAGTFAFGRGLPQGNYDVVALDTGTQELGVTSASVTARLTTSVSIVLEAVGAVEGVVFNAAGLPQPGALVSGGLALVTTDVNGFFRLEGVPGGRRTLEAGDPVTRRRGSVDVTVLPGQTVRAAITLEARATITGRVLDAAGAPVPRATVRIPAIDGYTFVFANDSGVYTFPDLPLGDYLIQAPGPSRDALIDFMTTHGLDPQSAFTSGDVPGDLPQVAAPPSDVNAVLAAYTHAVQTFMSVDDTPLTGLGVAPLGGFGWTRVQLFQDSTTIASDVQFLAQGAVGGRTLDAAGRPAGATTRVTGLAVSLTGFPTIAELGRINTDPATGRFDFSQIPRFDLTTFQTAGVRGGDFTVEAAQPFSPVIAQVRGQLTTTAPNMTDLVVQFPGAAETNGTIAGRVLLPGGAPAPAGTPVAIGFGDLTVLTDADGRFVSALPIPAGLYQVTAATSTGYRGRASVLVAAGQTAQVELQLLGLGTVTVAVRRTTGAPVVGAAVTLERGTFPFDKLNGVTDAAGSLRFTNVSEGPLAIRAEEAVTGLTGRASGDVVRDSDLPAVVTITPSGRVTGRFMSADGQLPIPFAQVALTAGALRAFATTDASGRFELLAIPVGAFTVEAGDPATGRLGRATDAIIFEGQTVEVTVLQLPRGTVTGVVVQADGTTTVAGATVRLVSNSFVATDLQATTRDDGTFQFEGVPAATFTMTARDPVGGFEGTASGRIDSEGQSIDVTVALSPFGALHVIVRSAAGEPVPNAMIAVSRGTFARSAAGNPDGTFTFDLLPLGDYQVVARSLSDTGDGGYGNAKLSVRGATVESVIAFRGAGSISVTVVAADGVTRVASAKVTLNAAGADAGSAPSPLASTAIAFTGANGDVTFASVPVGAVAAIAESAALAGRADGALAAAGGAAALTVRLGASGAVSGRVLLPDGSTPAAHAIVTLRFTPQSTLQSGVAQAIAALDGTFSFAGIPLGPFTVSAFEVVSNGVRNVSNALVTPGARLDLGDLVLDNAGPRVVSVNPVDRASGVAVATAVSVTFDEAIAAATVTTSPTGNLALMDGATAVAMSAPVFSADGRTVTMTPVQPLRSDARYTVIVRGGQDGPKDAGAGLPLLDSSVSTFTTRDVIPPTIVGSSPAAGERQVALESGVRVSFSEPVATAILQIRDSSGTLVAGQTALTAGNTAVTFSPVALLHANTTYVATLSGVADVAGNPLAVGSATIAFDTLDTIAPIITALQITGSHRAGSQLTITPIIPGTDARRVEYLAGTVPLVATTAPFAVTTTLPAAGSLTVSAVAIDEFGNRSSAVTERVDVLANAPPTITLRAVDPSAAILPGSSIEFEATAQDDDSIARVVLSAVGVAAYSETRPPDAPVSSFVARFSVPVPADAPSGGVFTVQAVAIDSAETASATARLQLTVGDGHRPVLTVLTPVNNAVVLPGQTVALLVDATDDVAVASVNVICTPALAGCGLRPIQPAVPATRQTFSLDVPAAVDGPSIGILIRATDTSGNVTETSRTLLVPDQVAPLLSALDAVSGSLRVVPGSTATLRATVSDAIGVTSLAYQSSGALVTSGTVPVTPAVTSGTALLALPIPASLPNAGMITVVVTARDAAGNASAPASLTLTVGDSQPPAIAIVSPPAGTQINPGQSVAFTVHATDDTGVSRLIFSTNGSVSASETRTVTTAASVDAQFTVSVPAGPTAGAFVFSAQAVDAAGISSAVATRSVEVRDTAAPVVSIVSPAANSTIDPRSPVTVSVSASDNVAVTAIDLAWSGAAAGLESRSVQPPAGSTTATFSVTIPTPPATGGALTLSAVARDAAGNTGSAAAVSLTVLDVVAPTVQAVVPADGATGVDPAASIVLTFSEPLDASTVSAAAVRLARSGVSVAASVSLTADGRTVTIAPAASLPVNTAITVSAADTILDRAGNHLAAFGSTFHTSSPDTTHPFLDSVNPADGTVGVAATTPIAATFSEPISPDSVTAQTFAVAIGGTPITGTFAFSSGGRIVTFTPSAALPFNATVVAQLSAGIADLAGNALATPGGDPLPAPVQVTFTTGAFAITSPSGAQIVEGDRIEIAAGASASLQVAQVVFTVGGTDIGTASASPFSVGFNVPARTASGSLTITASARNAQGVEIAHAEKTVTVVTRIQPVPAILGLARGAVGAIRLELDEPAAQDLVIALAPVDPRVVSVAAPSMTIPAGQTSATVAVTACSACPWDPVAAGSAAGNTSIVATSERGVALVVVSVSDPVHGQTIDAVASPVGVAATMPRRAADVLLASGSAARTLAITVLAQPLSGNAPVPVDISSSDPSVATATAPDLLPGQSVALLTIVAGRDGVATLIIRVGTEVWSVVVRVGTPPAGSGPIVTAAPVGLSVTAAPSAGQVVIATGRTSTITLQALSSINGGANAVPVAVTSSNAAIATATATAVQPGSSVTVLTITTFSNGIATLLLHVGNEVRSLTVVVGAQEPGRTPLALASPVGIASPALPVAGRVFAAAGGSVSVGIVLLEAPAAVQQSVTVTSSDPTIVTITASNPSIAAGSQVLQLSFATGHAGSATLTLTAGTTQRQVVVVVGGQSPDVQPVTMAPPVGLSVIPSAQVGRVLVAQGAPLAARLGVQLLATAQAASTTVVITSSNPAVVGLGAGASATTTLTAGTVAVPVDLFTSGAVGTAVLRFAFDGTVEELLVVVGNPPASDRPAITAPVIGIRIGS